MSGNWAHSSRGERGERDEGCLVIAIGLAFVLLMVILFAGLWVEYKRTRGIPLEAAPVSSR